jgi:hypothetical protein
MKKILIALVILAMAAHAHAMSDAKMKALLTGTWTDPYDGKASLFQADGKWQKVADGTDPYYSWDIEKGELLEMVPDPDVPKGIRPRHSWSILFLTKNEFLAEANFGDGRRYMFLTRD